MRKRLICLMSVSLLGLSLLPTSASAATKKCRGKAATIVGTSATETINGTKGPDVIVGLAGDDVILGRGGNDLVCGGKGLDVIGGFGGKDRLYGDVGGDVLVPGAGNDFADGGLDGDSVDFFQSPAPVNVDIQAGRATGEGSDTFVNVEGAGGSEFNDVIHGGDADNAIQGGGGDDLIDTGAGVDVIAPGPGVDSIDAGADVDALVYLFSLSPVQIDLAAGKTTGEGDDTFTGVDSTTDSPYDDTVMGTGDTNLFIAAAGNDQIHGQGGTDVVLYWFADQPMTVDLSAGTATGMGSDSFDSIEGVAGSLVADNKLTGTEGSNILWGGLAKDQMFGRGGDDILQGFIGDDLYDGGSGSFDGAVLSGGFVGVHADLNTGDVTGPGAVKLVGIEALEGTEFDDVLVGNGSENVIYGMAGNDQLVGNEGSDFLDGGDGSDQSDGGGGDDNCSTSESPLACEGSAPPPLHPLAEPVELIANLKRNF